MTYLTTRLSARRNSLLTPPDERVTRVEDLAVKPLCPDKTSVFYPGIPTWAMP